MTHGNTALATVPAGSMMHAPQAIMETAASAVAAQAKAAVEARYLVARANPRDWDAVRQKLLKECKRHRFADSARYKLPFGEQVEGPSIRFAEAVLRAMTNVLPETMVTYDDEKKRVVRIIVTDLEANLTYSKDLVIDKATEKLTRGNNTISSRTNSRGETVYLVPITEGELVRKQAAGESKVLRQLALRLIPGDIIDESMDVVLETLRKGVKDDPDAARKKIADAFSGLGVSVKDLSLFLGHDLAKCSPSELLDLRAIYAAISSGEATWQDALGLKQADRGEAQNSKRKDTDSQARLREKMAKRAKDAKDAKDAEQKKDAEPEKASPKSSAAKGKKAAEQKTTEKKASWSDNAGFSPVGEAIAPPDDELNGPDKVGSDWGTPEFLCTECDAKVDAPETKCKACAG